MIQALLDEMLADLSAGQETVHLGGGLNRPRGNQMVATYDHC